jgi:hypothetical protein
MQQQTPQMEENIKSLTGVVERCQADIEKEIKKRDLL